MAGYLIFCSLHFTFVHWQIQNASVLSNTGSCWEYKCGISVATLWNTYQECEGLIKTNNNELQIMTLSNISLRKIFLFFVKIRKELIVKNLVVCTVTQWRPIEKLAFRKHEYYKSLVYMHVKIFIFIILFICRTSFHCIVCVAVGVVGIVGFFLFLSRSLFLLLVFKLKNIFYVKHFVLHNVRRERYE